jgi:hypothetical protein
MSQEEVNSFMRQVSATVKGNHEGMARVIANAVGKGLDEACIKALEHSKQPFYDDDTVITFRKDGSIVTESHGSTTTERISQPHDQGSKRLNKTNEDKDVFQLMLAPAK